ncbi:MAG TPA: BON domain-containing protein [Aquabacterium sp.]|nr:BON domain-containing protein [Aquabacterium sp.]HQC98780.1 BON domain-containing protein [Aquabacterium sp.]
MTPKRFSPSFRMALLAAAVTSATLLGACAPLIIGGAMVGTALSVTDRRTSGAQVEDQAIELKAVARLRETVPAEANVSVTSYNRTVLLTGEAPTEAARAAAEQTVARIDNVRATVNELAVMGSTSVSARSNDSILTSKVKAAFVDAKDLQANALKVITERGTVYLMGRVTEREANRAAEIARATSGVGKVVKVFETITEAELAALQSK